MPLTGYDCATALNDEHMSQRLSVVIPTLNEAHQLPSLLEQLSEQIGVEMETIIADGGSTDATPGIAKDFGAKVVNSEPGRGCQMNRGAASSKSPLLLFLHADSSFASSTQLAESIQALQQTWIDSAN